MSKIFKTTDGQTFSDAVLAVRHAQLLSPGNPEVEEIEVDEEGNEAVTEKPAPKGKGKGK